MKNTGISAWHFVGMLALTGALLFSLSRCQPTAEAGNQDPLEKRIDSLLAKMTLQEKIGQTAQRGVSSREKGRLTGELKEAVRQGKIGAMLNVMDRDQVEELQRIAVEESPNGIPLIFARDVIHGFKTIFPIPLGQAATWNPDLVEQGARISAVEASAYGIRWTFAPMVDISRDPRWGRIAESPGEDPFLGSVLARAYVRGFQGDDLSAPDALAACAKHFAAYGAAEGGRDYNTANVPEYLLRDIYLPPFQAAVDEGAATFMTAFNDLNGIPCSGNQFLLRDILREEWGFDGLVVSDWNSVIEMIPHGYAANEKEAARQAAGAGLDMEMTSRAYENHLEELIQEGLLSETQLDEMVRNILRVKFRLGLFENPGFDRSRDSLILSEPHLEAAKEAAIQSLVLLENKDQLLPLANNQTVAVIGPLADAPHEQLGTWIFDGDRKDTRTPLPALRRYLGENQVVYAQGMTYSRDTSRGGFPQALSAAQASDVVLFFGGEESILSGEAHSRADISLPGLQEELILELSRTGKPVVLIIMAGRPITLGNLLPHVDAVLFAWHPGTMGGPAITEVLFGEAEPSGRLPVTWPKSAGQIPIYYNHPNTGRPPGPDSFVHMDSIPIGAWQSSLGNTSHYLDLGYLPQYPFGYGLSYTRFEYRDIQLSAQTLSSGDSLVISAELVNAGERAGTETVQLYIRDLVGSRVRPVRELKGFKKVNLAPGQRERVFFRLSANDLLFYNAEKRYTTEPGQFKVWIGGNASEGLEASFVVD